MLFGTWMCVFINTDKNETQSLPLIDSQQKSGEYYSKLLNLFCTLEQDRGYNLIKLDATEAYLTSDFETFYNRHYKQQIN